MGRDKRGMRVLGLDIHVSATMNVKVVREHTSLTQEQFAATFSVGLGELSRWERDDCKPRGAVLVFLNLIASEPVAVLRTVRRA